MATSLTESNKCLCKRYQLQTFQKMINFTLYFSFLLSTFIMCVITYHSGYCAMRQQLENSSHKNAKTEGLAKLMSGGQVIAFILTLKVILNKILL